jgi:hypothetical protein
MSLLTDPYSRPLARAALIQFGLLFVCGSMILDEGVVLSACRPCSATFWMGTIIILIRRRANPTPGDLAYIRWGLLIINVIGVPAFHAVWRMKGLIT